jgi:hypothetical protein
MRRVVLLASLVVGGAVMQIARAADAPLWLAVTTEALAPSIQPLAERRRAEGLEAVVFVGSPQDALAAHPRPAYLLLVGDAPGPDEAPDAAWHVPSVVMPLYRWREVQRETFASDSKWGELDGDEAPDVPVGRIPARTPDEAAAVVAKILAYEDRPWVVDDLRFPLWEGSPNYGPAMDGIAAATLPALIDSTVPKWGEPAVIVGLPTSPFCGWPAEHAATFNRWLQRGGQFAILAGHGNEESFFSMSYRSEWHGYHAMHAASGLQRGSPACPTILISCLTGNFAGHGKCLAEFLLFAPGGPVAAMGATTESHPLTNALHGVALARGLKASPQRLGDLWIAGLRDSRTERNLLFESLLANVEGSLEPKIDVAKLRRDQAWMYALLGDPATRLRLPGELTATIERAGDAWRWSVDPPAGAERLEVAFRPQVKPPAPGVAIDDPAKAQAAQDQANATYAYQPIATLSANQPWRGETTERGELRLLAIGPDAWWVCVLKVGE